MFLVSLGLVVVLLANGCQANATTEGTAGSSLADQLEFDVGIIFASESNYLCIPFERLGIAPAAQITTIETSCKCVQGSVVSYLTPNQSMAWALRLDFISEPRSGNSEFVPLRLSVQISLEIEGVGSKREFLVKLMNSVQTAEVTISEYRTILPGSRPFSDVFPKSEMLVKQGSEK